MSFERFVRLASPRFDGTAEDGTYDSLAMCQDRLFNLSILEAYGVAYTLYQFSSLAKEWWGSAIACRPVSTPIMSWI